MLPVGLEPTTLALLAPCSTDWAMRALKEKDEKESINQEDKSLTTLSTSLYKYLLLGLVLWQYIPVDKTGSKRVSSVVVTSKARLHLKHITLQKSYKICRK